MEQNSDSDESELGELGEYHATRLKLRLQLSKWENSFHAANGRAPVYEDKKVDRVFQSLRSQLRATELAWNTAKQNGMDDDEIMTMRSCSTWRSGGQSSLRSAGRDTFGTCLSSRSAMSRARSPGRRQSISEREKGENDLRKMNKSAMGSFRSGGGSSHRSKSAARAMGQRGGMKVPKGRAARRALESTAAGGVSGVGGAAAFGAGD